MNNCYVLVYKSLLMLGVSSPPRKIRKQITFLSVTTSSMLLFFLWEAMLISYFSTPLKFQSFNSLEEFLSKTDKKVSSRILIWTISSYLCCFRYNSCWYLASFYSYMSLKAPHMSTRFEMRTKQLSKGYGMKGWSHTWMICQP